MDSESIFHEVLFLFFFSFSRLEELNNRPHPDNFTYFTAPNNFVMFTSNAYLPNTDTAYLVGTYFLDIISNAYGSTKRHVI